MTGKQMAAAFTAGAVAGFALGWATHKWLAQKVRGNN